MHISNQPSLSYSYCSCSHCVSGNEEAKKINETATNCILNFHKNLGTLSGNSSCASPALAQPLIQKRMTTFSVYNNFTTHDIMTLPIALNNSIKITIKELIFGLSHLRQLLRQLSNPNSKYQDIFLKIAAVEKKCASESSKSKKLRTKNKTLLSILDIMKDALKIESLMFGPSYHRSIENKLMSMSMQFGNGFETTVRALVKALKHTPSLAPEEKTNLVQKVIDPHYEITDRTVLAQLKAYGILIEESTAFYAVHPVIRNLVMSLYVSNEIVDAQREIYLKNTNI